MAFTVADVAPGRAPEPDQLHPADAGPGRSRAVLAGTVLVVITCMLRRLHDMSRGVGTLLMLLLGSFMLPYMLLVLFFWPGDPLPNRYGPPNGSRTQDGQGLQARLRQLNGFREPAS
ncbi:MAG: hypothetical protein CVV08_18395 [Gammaproteobacteria bacterium HGW-Gammaproteobacteria-12]|nr:MAG: hypothetical protein CVV08_18395 [Gammaproteobacteria bacterium HGW-Gammaproteobacteria-12]